MKWPSGKSRGGGRPCYNATQTRLDRQSLHGGDHAGENGGDLAAQEAEGNDHSDGDDAEDDGVLSHRLARLLLEIREQAAQVLDQGNSPPSTFSGTSPRWAVVLYGLFRQMAQLLETFGWISPIRGNLPLLGALTDVGASTGYRHHPNGRMRLLTREVLGIVRRHGNGDRRQVDGGVGAGPRGLAGRRVRRRDRAHSRSGDDSGGGGCRVAGLCLQQGGAHPRGGNELVP